MCFFCFLHRVKLTYCYGSRKTVVFRTIYNQKKRESPFTLLLDTHFFICATSTFEGLVFVPLTTKSITRNVQISI